jgi:hypothetical protein
MSETPSEPPANEAAEERAWELPSWRRIGEFLANVLRLERSIETLKTQNTLLQQVFCGFSGRSTIKRVN